MQVEGVDCLGDPHIVYQHDIHSWYVCNWQRTIDPGVKAKELTRLHEYMLIESRNFL